MKDNILGKVTFAMGHYGPSAKWQGKIAFEDPESSNIKNPKVHEKWTVVAVRENEQKNVYFLTLGEKVDKIYRIFVDGELVFWCEDFKEYSRAADKAVKTAKLGSKLEFIQGVDYHLRRDHVKWYEDASEKHENRVYIEYLRLDSVFFPRFWECCKQEWAQAGIEPVPEPQEGEDGLFPMGKDVISWRRLNRMEGMELEGDIHVLTAEHCRCIKRAIERYTDSLSKEERDAAFSSYVSCTLRLDTHPDNK